MGDYPGQQDDGQIPRVLLDPGVPQGQDLIRRCGKAHGAPLVDLAIGVHIALGQLKFKFGLHK